MKFRITIDIPEETIINYSQSSKEFIDLLNEKNLEEFIRDTVQDQTQWDVESCSLIDKKDLKQIRELFKDKS